MNITSAMTPDSIRSNDDYTDAAVGKVLIDLGKTDVNNTQRMFRTICACVLRNPGMYTESENQDEFMTKFSSILFNSLTDDLKKDVPIASKGKTKGSPAFRSWAVTKPRWQYAGYLFNALSASGGIDKVFPADKPLPTLAQVRGMQDTGPEDCMKTIKKSFDLIEKKLADVKIEDHHLVNSAIAELQRKWAEHVASALAPPATPAS